jgi:hypothetical protein
VSYRQDAHQTKASSVRTTWIPVRTFLYVEKLRNALSCISPDDSAAHPDDSQCSIKLQDFFPKHRYGKITATVQTIWIPVRTLSSIREVSQFKSRRPDASQHGLDTRASDMEIECIRSAVRMLEASVWKLLAANLRPSGQGYETGKIFSEIFRISVEQLSVQTSYDHRPDGAKFYQARRSFELSAYKYRPLGLRIARIRYRIPLVLRKLHCEIIELS